VDPAYFEGRVEMKDKREKKEKSRVLLFDEEAMKPT